MFFGWKFISVIFITYIYIYIYMRSSIYKGNGTAAQPLSVQAAEMPQAAYAAQPLMFPCRLVHLFNE